MKEKKRKKRADIWEDDCPVCQLFKQAEVTGRLVSLDEVKDSMLRAKEKGAVVGGELFERPDAKQN